MFIYKTVLQEMHRMMAAANANASAAAAAAAPQRPNARGPRVLFFWEGGCKRGAGDGGERCGVVVMVVIVVMVVVVMCGV